MPRTNTKYDKKEHKMTPTRTKEDTCMIKKKLNFRNVFEK